MIISNDINILKYGLGTYQIVVWDKYTPDRVAIVVNIDDLIKLRDEINQIILNH